MHIYYYYMKLNRRLDNKRCFYYYLHSLSFENIVLEVRKNTSENRKVNALKYCYLKYNLIYRKVLNFSAQTNFFIIWKIRKLN